MSMTQSKPMSDAPRPKAKKKLPRMTDQQIRVLKFIAAGRHPLARINRNASYKAIAAHLGVAHGTAHLHVSALIDLGYLEGVRYKNHSLEVTEAGLTALDHVDAVPPPES